MGGEQAQIAENRELRRVQTETLRLTDAPPLDRTSRDACLIRQPPWPSSHLTERLTLVTLLLYGIGRAEASQACTSVELRVVEMVDELGWGCWGRADGPGGSQQSIMLMGHADGSGARA